MAERIGHGPGTVPRLEMKGIRKAFGATVALNNVDFSVNAGEVHALIGENGAGKSTLMQVLAGAIRSDSGEMLLDGIPYRPRHPHAARSAGVAMIFQELSLAPHMSVEDNIVLGMEPAMFGVLRTGRIRNTAREALARLGHADLDTRIPAGFLPIGIRQVVEIARAIAVGCKVLVLDEPTSSLGRKDIERLFELIRRLRQQGCAIVYISHFLEEVREIGDSFTAMRDGKVAGSGQAGSTTTAAMADMMIGRKLNRLYPHSDRTPGEIVLELDCLAGVAKPQSASLSLRRGEVLGIAGLVGSGRTELLRTIFGLDAVKSGRIKVAGLAGPASPARRWTQGVGFLSEDRRKEGLAVSMNIADNLTLSSLDRTGPAGLLLPWRQRQAALDWISRMGIKCRDYSQKTAELSGGNQQKVALARILHHGADVLLLDEPTRGVDVGSKEQIYRLMDDLATGMNHKPAAILMASSYLPELIGICDRIAVMHRGILSEPAPAGTFDEKQLMIAVMGGEECA